MTLTTQQTTIVVKVIIFDEVLTMTEYTVPLTHKLGICPLCPPAYIDDAPGDNVDFFA